MGVAGVAPLDDGALSTQLGTDVFLHGRYMEVGVHGSGSLGTATGAPSGFVGTTGVFYPWSGGVGLITDFGQDGFDVGVPTPFSGDYFLPGKVCSYCIGVAGCKGLGACGTMAAGRQRL
jgi:hypothetical protein